MSSRALQNFLLQAQGDADNNQGAKKALSRQLGKAMIIGNTVVMMGIIGILILEKGKHSHFLLLQCVYYLAYFTPILYISYGQ